MNSFRVFRLLIDNVRLLLHIHPVLSSRIDSTKATDDLRPSVRLVVGSPAKEHLLKKAIEAASVDNNAQKYPTLFAFHGSAVANWHSILREGLHFKQTVNGRAYGHGVYCTSSLSPFSLS